MLSGGKYTAKTPVPEWATYRGDGISPWPAEKFNLDKYLIPTPRDASQGIQMNGKGVGFHSWVGEEASKKFKNGEIKSVEVSGEPDDYIFLIRNRTGKVLYQSWVDHEGNTEEPEVIEHCQKTGGQTGEGHAFLYAEDKELKKILFIFVNKGIKRDKQDKYHWQDGYPYLRIDVDRQLKFTFNY